MNGDKFFLDTNVFVYCFDAGAPAKRDRAWKLVETALGTNDGVVSAQVAHEFCNVMLRRPPADFQPADLDATLSTIFAPLLENFGPMVLVHAGLELHRRYRLAWYDALIVAAAQEAGCALLYSEDLQHGAHYGVLRVLDPFR
jgi:predicted nucleic acid-binding protein